jgi:hypothetical protein
VSGIIARRALSGRAHMAGALNADVLPNLPTGCIWELAHTDAGIWHKVTTGMAAHQGSRRHGSTRTA